MIPVLGFLGGFLGALVITFMISRVIKSIIQKFVPEIKAVSVITFTITGLLVLLISSQTMGVIKGIYTYVPCLVIWLFYDLRNNRAKTQ